jgi:beta-glucosidase
LRAEYWTNPRWEGERSLVRIELQVELNRGFFDLPGLGGASAKIAPLPAELGAHISVRWTGTLIAPTSGDYLLSLTTLGTARLYLDDQLLIDGVYSAPERDPTQRQPTAEELWTGAGAQIYITTQHLIAGEPHAIKIEYAADVPDQSWVYGAQIRFGWQPPADVVMPLIAEAAALAQQSDVAIVVARTFEGESQDRPHLQLPNGQDQLIRAVAAANPRTIVVLMSGGPVATASWEQHVPAILEAWYPGQEQGNAVTRVLWGDVTPSGKLPLTFPRSEAATPVATRAQYPGIDGVVHYTEGVFVGYRGYDQFNIEPQYPFGYGLSYTSFAYADLELTPPSTTGMGSIQVSFAVTNTGDRAGVEIAQVYVGMPESAGAPPKQLVGWTRVLLAPGERRHVSVMVDPQSPERPLSCWNADTDNWQIANGDYHVYVGASSRDIRLEGTFRIDQSGEA